MKLAHRSGVIHVYVENEQLYKVISRTELKRRLQEINPNITSTTGVVKHLNVVHDDQDWIIEDDLLERYLLSRLYKQNTKGNKYFQPDDLKTPEKTPQFIKDYLLETGRTSLCPHCKEEEKTYYLLFNEWKCERCNNKVYRKTHPKWRSSKDSPTSE